MSYGTGLLASKYHLYLGDIDVEYKVFKLPECKVELEFIVDDYYDFTRGAEASINFNGRTITIRDDVWLTLKSRGYANNFHRRAQWTEKLDCCTSCDTGAGSGGGGRR